MASRKTPFLVPYTANGSIMEYEQTHFSHFVDAEGTRHERNEVYEWTYDERMARGISPVYTGPDMRPNDIWSGTLRLRGFERGRSAARFIWEADGDPVDDRRTYPMFMTDMVDLLTTIGVQPGGLVFGRWIVAKRGANYGIKLVTT